MFLREPLAQLLQVDVLVPVVRAAGHDPDQGSLGDEFGGDEGQRRARDGGSEQPTPGPEVFDAASQEGGGMGGVLQDLEQGHYVVCWGDWGLVDYAGEFFDRTGQVAQFGWAEGRVAALVGYGHLDHRRSRVDARHGRGLGESGCRRGEDSPTAADVEIGVGLLGRGWAVAGREGGPAFTFS